ncbi:MAG: 4-hydroxy-tetrahydrodipicolinate reductase [Clostridia bacterium]|nr:4-hydroxy-tetrahydrodipicolinate reductase [Clostridia bacterium]MBQ7380401.1 4-hydroxy-tetrahydrodipicolinate reductase [Clostridia bacterium]
MKVMIIGAAGRMGKELLALVQNGYAGTTAAIGIDAYSDEYPHTPGACGEIPDVIVDFSHMSATDAVLDWAVANNVPCVIGTTGHTEQQLSHIAKAAEHIPVFHSGNMSVGIAVLLQLAKQTARAFPDADIEIIEVHHKHKADAPSGTALMLAKAIEEVRPDSRRVLGRSGQGKREPQDIGISAVRMGNVVGEHKVCICTDSQTITLEHKAHTRALFAEGALTAAAYIRGKTPGLYNMQVMLDELNKEKDYEDSNCGIR